MQAFRQRPIKLAADVSVWEEGDGKREESDAASSSSALHLLNVPATKDTGIALEASMAAAQFQPSRKFCSRRSNGRDRWDAHVVQ